MCVWPGCVVWLPKKRSKKTLTCPVFVRRIGASMPETSNAKPPPNVFNDGWHHPVVWEVAASRERERARVLVVVFQPLVASGTMTPE